MCSPGESSTTDYCQALHVRIATLIIRDDTPPLEPDEEVGRAILLDLHSYSAASETVERRKVAARSCRPVEMSALTLRLRFVEHGRARPRGYRKLTLTNILGNSDGLLQLGNGPAQRREGVVLEFDAPLEGLVSAEADLRGAEIPGEEAELGELGKRGEVLVL